MNGVPDWANGVGAVAMTAGGTSWVNASSSSGQPWVRAASVRARSWPVAVRAGLDHPEVVTHLAGLDVLTNLDTWDVLSGLSAAVAWHLYLMAQPAGLPEAMISGAADEFFGSFLDAWAHDPAAMPADVRAEYLRASREAVPSIVADYRASAHVDVEHDRADRETGNRLRMPVTVLQQDWGPELSSGAAAMWSAWAADLDHRTVTSGHFMAEEAPGEVIAAVRALLAR